MLSILIPIYNYNTFPLVFELQKQCFNCNIKFEILCQDDCSNSFLLENNKINTLKNCFFSSNVTNLGRARNRNYLASKAKFQWLLLLDCDMFPKESNFIKNYLLKLEKNDNQIIFGGILYQTEKPKKEQLLRWIYGHKRESLSVEKRNKKPNRRALTSNLLLKKEFLLRYPFDSAITKYGYEDLFFVMTLEVNKIVITHIENPTYHLNLETSKVFLAKTRVALENLALINSKNTFLLNNKITATYSILNKLKIIQIIIFTFNTFENKITINLFSRKPSLLLFDIYKLGYYCKLKSK